MGPLSFLLAKETNQGRNSNQQGCPGREKGKKPHFPHGSLGFLAGHAHDHDPYPHRAEQPAYGQSRQFKRLHKQGAQANLQGLANRRRVKK
jgi:hypothetical protein